METKNKLTGKFIIVFDTICDGEQTVLDDNKEPKLFDSYDEAFKEIFDDALSMLSNYSEEELAEYCELKLSDVEAMNKIFESGDVRAMEKFLDDNSDCNTNNESVIPAEDFILGRKIIFTGK